MSALERADIQGNVVRGYGYGLGHARYVVARVRDPSAARRWVAAQAEPVTTALEWETTPPSAYNLALSFAGLRALEVPGQILESFPADFREGMQARSERLGDVGPSAPALWDEALRGEGMHVVATMHAADATTLEREAALVREGLRAGGLDVVAEQPAGLLGGNREHFGFTDGFGQPAIAGEAREAVAGQGVPVRWWPWTGLRREIKRSESDRRVGWRALAAGEFVLGYDDEDGGRPAAPARPFQRNGTFMVWRKLRQDVAGFRAFLVEAASSTGLDADTVAAKLVGRWPDGSPLVLRPHGPDAALGDDRACVNDFAYARADPDGMRCPRGAHVRRTNPRDALGWGGRLTARHRILRRGMPYGDPLASGVGDDGADRGLIFVCLQASIERQFEIVQTQWCNDGDAFGLGRAPDPLAGSVSGPARVTIPGDPPRYATAMASFVSTRGGEYLFVPGITSLRAFAEM